MRYRWFVLSSLSVLLTVFCPPFSEGKITDVKVEKGEGPVDIEADELSYERERQVYEAHGRVEVRRGDLSLKGDHAQLNMATKDLTAWGNVVLREGEDVLECERLEINLDTKLGKIYQAKLFLKDQNFHITSKEAEKLGENQYRIREGSFTTCDAERPPWKFTVKELEVTVEGYGIAKGPTFYLEGIPSLYLPWGLFPVRKERQTGLLLPRLGYSRKYGPEMKNAFFWAMTKDMDSTLYFDYLGKRGFKEGLEYRYAFTPETHGQASFHFIDDHHFNKNRYAFFAQHQQKFPYNFYLKGNINHVSDNRYHRDFDEDLPGEAKIDSRSRAQLRSTVFGGKNWDRFSFLTEASVFQDLTKKSNDEVIQKLPQVSFQAHPQALFNTPLFFDGGASYTNFWREKGVEGYRGDLFPRLFYPVRLFNVLKVESSVGPRETLYKSFDDPIQQYKGWESRETVVASTEVSTEFYKIYEAGTVSKISRLYKVAKWMHTIEPMISYQYAPRVNQKDLPTFDDLDRIPYSNQITYGFTQRLIGKPEKEGVSSGPSEYGKLKIFQSYSLGDPFTRDSKGKGRNFSNIQGELWWNFSPYLSAKLDGEFSPYHGNLEVGNASINIKDKRDDAIFAQYRYAQRNIKEVNAGARIKTIPPLYVYGSVRYNLLDHWKVENIYGAEYQAQCWRLGVTVEDKGRSPDRTQEKELKFHVYVNLLGLGSLGKRSYFMGL
ncbi:MAG: LPS-assembly protein LptD [Deltaproteobacteria bacterium]|nr:LPS-assembly protein LptD [Deltaproteobacteria bacterium]MBM4324237.1 LPS-assembly protein LptD [Deltaproteobacteria bacterium]